MTTKRYRVHGTYIDDYSQTQTTVEMVMASDYDNLQAELDGPSGPTQLQLDKTEIGELQRENARLRAALEQIAANNDFLFLAEMAEFAREALAVSRPEPTHADQS